MKYTQCLLGALIIGSSHGMGSHGTWWPIHSLDSGKKLKEFWLECDGVSLDKVTPEAKRMYLFIKECMQEHPAIANWSPQLLAKNRLKDVYWALHEKILALEPGAVPQSPKLLMEESARTIEGILNYLISVKKTS